nr:sodium-coupled monocarboxylate transporter 1-like [Cherax quadricarinatus]
MSLRWSVKDIYELSYCYIGVSAIFITLIVSNIVSFCTALIIGLIGTGLGILMEKLGGVLEVGTMFSGIICGPLCGIFLAGILTPWVNAKGAMVGGLTAFVLSAWVVVGSFVHGSAPRYLSLSTSGCPVNLTSVDNITVIFFSNSSATDSYMYKTVTRDYQQINSTLSDLPTPTTVQGWSVKDIYELSYCYIGVSAIFITLIVSNIVSFCTGNVY